jgi:hypothetical protein
LEFWKYGNEKIRIFKKMKSSENPRIPKMEIFDISKIKLFFPILAKKFIFSFEERKINFIQRISYKYLTKNLSIRKYCENIVKFFLSLPPCLPFFRRSKVQEHQRRDADRLGLLGLAA